ncbi:hypothetical protein AYX14_01750 [Cryptococcus neoformans]|nr:hypothetical protein AYX15_05161 [Cryptococcus neoformans var. grubii]OWZ72854.1 hypothetical protein AYX14_01750 [Cryptococcus neoformans var. grubii]OWZ78800.1 mango esterase [Cryptococcus neoformans var. grubii Bt85]OXM79957.1 mango esterase [Cryptococcus neoformans var. grubii Bt63]
MSSKKTHIDQIVLIGDSLTQFALGEKGFAVQLANHFQRQFDVVVRGFSGYNSRWVLEMARLFMPELKRIRLAVVLLGTNDALLPPEPRAIDPESYKANIAKIVSLVPLSAKIILVSPPPYSLKGKAKDLGLEYYPGINLDRDPVHSLLYNLKARELADNLNEAGDRKGNVAFCDIRTPMEKAALEDSPDDLEEGLFKYLRDGVHLSPDGYQCMYETLLHVIKSRFPEFEQEPYFFADYETIDHTQPEKYFE